jgi:hypothetical protein
VGQFHGRLLARFALHDSCQVQMASMVAWVLAERSR